MKPRFPVPRLVALLMPVVLMLIVWLSVWCAWRGGSGEGFLTPTRVVVSLTTSPTRLPKIEQTLVSLYHNQTRKPDMVELNLPHVFKRDGSKFNDNDVERFAAMPFVRVHRCEDVGPITKFVPTLTRHASEPQTMIIVVDDDTMYPPRLVERFVAAAERQPDAIVTAHCTDWYTHNRTSCDMLEGFKSYLIRPALFGAGFWEYLRVALDSPSCYVADDYVLSNYVHTAGVPVLRLSDSEVGKTPQLAYGFDDDALHKQDVQSHTEQRYCGCYQHLKERLPSAVRLRAHCATDRDAL